MFDALSRTSNILWTKFVPQEPDFFITVPTVLESVDFVELQVILPLRTLHLLLQLERSQEIMTTELNTFNYLKESQSRNFRKSIYHEKYYQLNNPLLNCYLRFKFMLIIMIKLKLHNLLKKLDF